MMKDRPVPIWIKLKKLVYSQKVKERKRIQQSGMNALRDMSDHSYKGHNIRLILSLEGYMWACQYVILKSGKTEMDGFAGNTYASREEAESAALARAKTLIDESKLSKDPLWS